MPWGAIAFVATAIGMGLVLRGVFDWGAGFIAFAALITAWRVGFEHPRTH